ncbi:MAG: hypothetical protein JW969_16820 [Spirochaetales bacterium]|nr:hypothetical protein [Spirochaetales bacterium]
MKSIFSKVILIIIPVFTVLLFTCDNGFLRDLVEEKVAGPSIGDFYINGPSAPPTNTTSVTLYMSADNAFEMRFLNEGDVWTGWETYSDSRSWTLLSGDGLKTVYAEFRDEGYHVISASDSIYLDTSTPGGLFNINNNGTYSTTGPVSLNMNLSDTDEMRFSNDNANWTSWVPYNTSYSWDLTNATYGGTATNGNKTVYGEFRTVALTVIPLTDDIIFDDTPPVINSPIIINGGAVTTTNNLADLTYDVTDAFADVEMRFSNNNSLWSLWEVYASTKTGWDMTSATYGGSGGGGDKDVYAVFRDPAGNTTSVMSDTITYDGTAPVGSIIIANGNAGTTTTTVDLTLSATDDYSGVAQMQFSNNGSSWSPLEPYSTSKTGWNLASATYGGTSVQGTKWVYVRYTDNFGNLSSACSDTIVYDTTGPSITNAVLTISNITLDSFQVNWAAASDTYSGPVEYRVLYSTGNNLTTLGDADLEGIGGRVLASNWGATGSPIIITGLTAGTQYYVNVFARDSLNNRSMYTSNSATTLIYKFVMVGDSGYSAYTLDGGLSWISTTSGVAVTLYGVAYGHEFGTSTRVIAVGASGTMIRSDDQGATWAALTSGTANNLLSVVGGTNTDWVASDMNGNLLYSWTNGASWTSVNVSTNKFNRVEYDPTRNRFVAIGDMGGFAYSTDRGATWITSAVGGGNNVFLKDIAVNKTNGTYVAAGYNDMIPGGIIYRSTDGGTTWTNVYYNATGEYFYVVCTNNVNNYTASQTSGKYMFNSSDSGLTWAQGTYIETTLYGGDVNQYGIWLIVGSSNRVYRSTDGLTFSKPSTLPTGTFRDVVPIE